MVVSEPGSAGVRRHVCDLIDGLDLDKFAITFIYSLNRSDDTYLSDIRRFQRMGIRCVEIPMQRSISPLKDTVALVAILKVIRQWKPDIVHCHSAKAGFLGRVASRLSLTGATTAYTPNAMPCYFSKRYEQIERLAGRWTDWLIAVSESERSDFLSWRIVPPERIRVIPMAVKPAMIEHRVNSTEGKVIGACGRICHQKRSLFFFQAGERLLESDPTLRLKWVGDFSNDSEADEVRQHLSLSPYRDRIEITGWVDNPLEHLAMLDVFCMFSRYESFGFVTADAMQIGIPVVAIDATGTKDLVVHEKTGIICDEAVESAAAAISGLINAPERIALLVKNARSHVESRHSPELASALIQNFYSEIVDQLEAIDERPTK